MILSQLNVQTNSNLSFSFIKVKDLISWAQEKKLEYLSICDYYPFDFFDFFDLCHQAKIKLIVGIKVIIKINDYKKILSVYLNYNKGYK